MVRLRVLTASDWPLWREVRLAALGEAPHAFKSRLEDWDNGGQELWRARLLMPAAHNLVALLDGRPVGMAAGLPEGSGVCELRSVWVGPRARGRGVGDRLVAAVDAWAPGVGSRNAEARGASGQRVRRRAVPAQRVRLHGRTGRPVVRQGDQGTGDGETASLTLLRRRVPWPSVPSAVRSLGGRVRRPSGAKGLRGECGKMRKGTGRCRTGTFTRVKRVVSLFV